MTDSSCPFCEIIAGRAPAEILYHDESITVFKTIKPVTPVHVLIVPNQHITSINHVLPEHKDVLGQMHVIARKIASELQVDRSGYRLVINTGPDAGQSIFHLHMHLIGGRHLPFRFD